MRARAWFLVLSVGLSGGAGAAVWASDGEDLDGDGYLTPFDCNDGNEVIHPGAGEAPDNAVDEDCDGYDLRNWWADADGDTFGNGAVNTTGNVAPPGYVSNHLDCDDGLASVYPGAEEVPGNTLDDDCDGVIDEADAAPTTWYLDADGDSYGDAAVTQSAVSAPPGYVTDATDCDDSAAAVNPAAVEVANGADDDCDGVTDEYFSTTTYTGASNGYVANKNAKITFSAAVASVTPSCLAGRTVTFVLNKAPVPGGSSPYPIGSAVTGSLGIASKTVSTSSWTKPDSYVVTATTSDEGPCVGSASTPATLVLKVEKSKGRA